MIRLEDIRTEYVDDPEILKLFQESTKEQERIKQHQSWTQEKSNLLNHVITICLLLFISSCSASWHLKKAIQKGAQVEVDTVVKPITVFIPSVVKDTIFESRQGDTVRIEKERLRIKYVSLPGDSVYIHGESRADTIVREIPVTVTQIVTAPKDNKWKWIAIALGVILILLFLIVRK